MIPKMKITDLMQRKARGPTAATQAPGVPGGHKFWCSSCNGPRVHAVKLFAPGEAISKEVLRELTLQREGTRLEVRLSQTQETPSLKPRLAIVCRTCGKMSVLVFQAGVWMPEAFGKRLEAHVRRRAGEILGQFDKALMAAVTESPMPELKMPEPGVVEHMRGAVLKRFPEIRDMTHEDVDRAIERESEDHDDEEEAGRESGGSPRSADGKRNDPSVPAAAETAVPSSRARKRGSGLGVYVIMRAAYRQRHPMPARTKARVAGWALSAPFLLMGALYMLAWRGTYIWPIYYAIQPYYQPWMNEWWFAALSLIVPGIYAAIYYVRYGPLPEMPTMAGLHVAANLQKYQKLAKGTAMERPDWWNRE